MNKKIYLIEPSPHKDGHFFIYQKALLSIPGTCECPLKIDFHTLGKKNPIIQLVIITKSFFSLIKQVPKGEVAHVLYSDIYYKIPFIANKLIRERNTILTVHSCPRGKIKSLLMKAFYRNAKCVVVHSEYIKSQLEKIGLRNVHLIHYPSFYDYSNVPSKEHLRKKYGFSEGDIILGALGGLRHDKGVDILIDSMKYIDLSIKKRIILNIAGAPFDFSEKEIADKCQVVGVRAMLNIRFLTDQEFMEAVVVSDIMVFPYRSTMTANSGPMTEAMVNRKPCIIPKGTNLSAINDLYNVGITFEQENAESLCKVISEYICNSVELSYDIADELKVETFINKHKELYKRIIKI